jgi:hypothetical protein
MTGGDPPLTVTGGAGGVTAEVDDLATLARLSDDLAESLGRISAECQEMLVDPNVVASAVLDPGGAAAFERSLLGALDGSHGLTALALGFTEQAVLLRATDTTGSTRRPPPVWTSCVGRPASCHRCSSLRSRPRFCWPAWGRPARWS